VIKMHPILRACFFSFTVYILINDDDNGSVYNKTLEYVKTFAKFNTTDSASAVRECVDYSHFCHFPWFSFITFVFFLILFTCLEPFVESRI